MDSGKKPQKSASAESTESKTTKGPGKTKAKAVSCSFSVAYNLTVEQII